MSRLILESTMYSWLFSEKDDRDGYWDQLEKLRLVGRFQILHLSPNLSSFEIHVISSNLQDICAEVRRVFITSTFC